MDKSWGNLFKDFKSINEFNAFYKNYPSSKSTLKSFSNIDKISDSNGKSEIWFGTTNIESVKAHEYSTFIDPNLPKKAKDLSKLISSSSSFGDSFKKSRIITDDMPIGVFNFALASKGMHKGFDFYSDELKSVVPKEDVRKSGDKYIYESSNSHEVRLVDEVDPVTGETVYITNNRKVYQRRSNKSNTKKISIFIPVGGNGEQTAKSLAYRCLPALIVSSILEQSGIKVGLYMARSFRWQEKIKYSFVTAKLKDYGDKANYNKILMYTSDPRFFRYEMFKNTTKIADSSGLVGSMTGYKAGTLSGEDYLKSFEIWKAVQVCKANKTNIGATPYGMDILSDEKKVKKYKYDLQTMLSPDIYLDPDAKESVWNNEVMSVVIQTLAKVDFLGRKNSVSTYNNAMKMQDSLMEKGVITEKFTNKRSIIRAISDIPVYSSSQKKIREDGLNKLKNV